MRCLFAEVSSWRTPGYHGSDNAGQRHTRSKDQTAGRQVQAAGGAAGRQ